MPIKNPPRPSERPKTPYRYTPSALTDGIKNFVKRNEDFKHFFYKDTKDNVTVGTGHRDWKRAAEESERDIGGNDERNDKTKELFFIAQRLEKRKPL